MKASSHWDESGGKKTLQTELDEFATVVSGITIYELAVKSCLEVKLQAKIGLKKFK